MTANSEGTRIVLGLWQMDVKLKLFREFVIVSTYCPKTSRNEATSCPPSASAAGSLGGMTAQVAGAERCACPSLKYA